MADRISQRRELVRTCPICGRLPPAKIDFFFFFFHNNALYAIIANAFNFFRLFCKQVIFFYYLLCPRYLSFHQNMLVRSSVTNLQSLQLHQLKEDFSLEVITTQTDLNISGDGLHVEGLLLRRVRTTSDITSLWDSRHTGTRFYSTISAPAVATLFSP